MPIADAPVLNDPATDPAREAAVVAKVMRRLIPFMCFLYFLNYVDRVNIQFAKLEMNKALGLNDAQYGLAAGIFFVGYCLFEIPSNLIMERVGARRWIARIMISWGIVSTCMCFLTGAKSFYTLRLLLGFAEAGFFPGMVLYLAHWVPAYARARALAWFLTSTALAGVIGSPIAGLLLGVNALGLAGWQWLFLLEGIPTIVFGVVTWFVLVDRPADARWLTDSSAAPPRPPASPSSTPSATSWAASSDPPSPGNSKNSPRVSTSACSSCPASCWPPSASPHSSAHA